MMKYLLAFVLVLLGASAQAQTYQCSGNLGAAYPACVGTTQTAAPSASVGTIAVTSTNNRGSVSGLSAATALTITFAAPSFLTPPSCAITGSTTLATPSISSVSTASVAIAMTAFTGTIYYVCF